MVTKTKETKARLVNNDEVTVNWKALLALVCMIYSVSIGLHSTMRCFWLELTLINQWVVSCCFFLCLFCVGEIWVWFGNEHTEYIDSTLLHFNEGLNTFPLHCGVHKCNGGWTIGWWNGSTQGKVINLPLYHPIVYVFFRCLRKLLKNMKTWLA